MSSFRNGRFKALAVGSGVIFLGLFFAGFSPVNAATGLITCSTTLSGANEVPPNSSTATGSVSYTFDPSTTASTWSVTFSGLTAPATAAHVHAPAPPGSNAGVQVPLTTIPSATSGSYSGSEATFGGTLTVSAYMTALLTGDSYANIHTSTFPGGEIRGWLSCTQSQSVPEFSPILSSLAVAAILLPIVVALGRKQPSLRAR